MASIWTGLLFLHGHIANVELARSLSRDTTRATQTPLATADNPARTVSRSREPDPAACRHSRNGKLDATC
jgi:hypothetical protein